MRLRAALLSVAHCYCGRDEEGVTCNRSIPHYLTELIVMQRSSRKLFSGLSAVFLLSAASACGDSSTEPGGEQEVISRVTLSLTPSSGGSPIVVFIDDPDGNGPQSPSAQVGTFAFARGASYTGTVKFENRLENPPEDITQEVAAESNEHRVFYSTTGAGVVVTTTDVDLQGRPLGLTFTAAAGTVAGSGALRVVLCHFGNTPKPAAVTSCTADTDINVVFNYTITN